MSDSSPTGDKVIAKQSVPIRQLTYCSEATSECHLGSLKEIYESSKINNAALSVTGFLLFSGMGLFSHQHEQSPACGV